MNRLFAILLLCASTVGATDVRFNFQNALRTTGPVSNKVVQLKPASTPGADGTAVILREPITTNSYTGTIIISNMVPGLWDITVSTPVTPTTFRINVPETNVLVEASAIMSTAANPPQTYLASVIDNLFVRKLNSWASNLIVTNLVIPAGAQSGYVWTSTDTSGTGSWAVATGGGGGSPATLNVNQFDTSGGRTNIKSGALLTNTFEYGLFSAQNMTNTGFLNTFGPASFYTSLTNWGSSRFMGSATFETSLDVGPINLSQSSGQIQARSLILQNLLDMGGGSIVGAGSLAATGIVSFANNDYLTASRALVLDASKQLVTASGTPDGTKFLRDDGTYASPNGTPPPLNVNQFDTSGGVTNIKSGAFLTNIISQSTLESRGSITNTGAGNQAGPFVTYSAVTNRGTVRNMARVTNDLGVVTVGVVENQAGVTNSTYVNTAGGTTNYGATSQIGISTNTGAISARRQTNYSDSASIAPLASIGSTNIIYGPAGSGDGVPMISDAQGHGRWTNLNLSSSAAITGTLPVGNGGIGGSAPAGNGSLLMGNGTLYQPTPIVTYNGINVTNTSGTRMDIAITGGVQLAYANITGAANVNSLTSTGAIVGGSTENLTGALNAGGATTLSNTLAVVGATTLSTLTNSSHATFGGAVTNKGPFVFQGTTNIFVATNGASPGATLVSPDGTNAQWSTLLPSYDAGFPNMRLLVETNNAPFFPLFMGDSLLTGFLDISLVEWFVRSAGFAGGWGGGNAASLGVNIWTHTNSVGVSEVSRDFLWEQVSWDLTNGTHVTFQGSAASPSILANIFTVSFVASNGAGAFKLQTNLNNTTWVDMTAVTNANNGGAVDYVTLFFTNAAAAPVQLRVVGQSLGASNPAVRIIGAGMWNSSARGGYIYGSIAVGGGDISEYVTQTNGLGKVLRALRPTILIYNAVDGQRNGTNLFQSFLPFLEWTFATYVTNSDIFFISTPPEETTDDQYLSQDHITYAACLRNQWSFFNTRQYLGSSSNAIKWGYMVTGDPHTTTKGSKYITDSIADYARFWTSDSKHKGNSVFYATDNSLAITTTNPIVQMRRPDESIGLGLTWNSIDTGPGGVVYLWKVGSLGSGKLAIGSDPTSSTPAQNLSWYGDAASLYASAAQPGNIIVSQAQLGAKFQRQIGTNLFSSDGAGFVMTADGSATNFTTTTNTWWGTGIGTRSFGGNIFNTVGDSMEWLIEGNFWTGATPGNCRIMQMINTTSATNVVAQVLVAPPANSAGLWFRARGTITCRTTGASGTLLSVGSIAFQGASEVGFTNSVLTVDLTAAGGIRPDLMSTNGAATDSFLARSGKISLAPAP